MSQLFKRRLIRERVLQVLYACEMNSECLSDLTKLVLSDITDADDREFATDLINRCIINRDELNRIIMERVSNWEMNRIALIDRILLRIGICEILYFPQIPPKVSINEAIEISKNYSTAGSGKFINGILDAILNELKASGKISKSGRGLVDKSFPRSSSKKKNL